MRRLPAAVVRCGGAGGGRGRGWYLIRGRRCRHSRFSRECRRLRAWAGRGPGGGSAHPERAFAHGLGQVIMPPRWRRQALQLAVRYPRVASSQRRSLEACPTVASSSTTWQQRVTEPRVQTGAGPGARDRRRVRRSASGGSRCRTLAALDCLVDRHRGCVDQAALGSGVNGPTPRAKSVIAVTLPRAEKRDARFGSPPGAACIDVTAVTSTMSR